MTTATCPDAAALTAFALGRVPEAFALGVEAHLAGCPRCLAALAALDPPDPLLAAVRTVPRVAGDDAETAVLLERLRPVFSPAAAGETARADGPTPAASGPAPPPTWEPEWVGPYRVLGVLGRGGMGTVYRADDPLAGRQVAVKVVRPELAAVPGAADRFRREVRAAAALRHPHVVTVYHVGEDAGRPFLAMELLDGEPLDARLRREGRLPPAEVARVGRQAAEGLAAAHAAGVVHRDVKPANLWLEAPGGRVKVIDFGLARGGSPAEASTGGVVGTPAFMAPEQARPGSPVDHRADLFALGCVLYRAATGRNPFAGDDAVSVLVAAATETPAPPARLAPDVPPALSRLILALLEKTPDRRPASAAVVADRLRGLEAAPPRPPRRATPVALALMLLAVAGAVAGWVIVRDRDGKEVQRVPVPDGGRVEVVPDAEPPAPAPGPTDPAAPPPLADWLKGRTVLTVAQDGSGQYRSIQAALNAVSPGQAVRVLDAATYRERLSVQGVRDVGLVSERGATIELHHAEKGPLPWGHYVINAERFRLHGFRVHFPADDSYIGFSVKEASGVVIENCWVSCVRQDQAKNRLYAGLGIESVPEQLRAAPVTVRGCRFDTTLLLDLWHPGSALAVEQNLFTGRHDASHLVVRPRGAGPNAVRHNVFAGDAGNGDLDVLQATEPRTRLEIAHNTFTSRAPVGFSIKLGTRSVTLRDNVQTRTYIACFRATPQTDLELTKDWRLGPNAYADRATRVQGWVHVVYDVPRAAGDVLGHPEFLSDDPAARDYLRPPAGGPLARGGSGGTYFGALPPGPAPKGGDWFTRVREKWGTGPK